MEGDMQVLAARSLLPFCTDNKTGKAAADGGLETIQKEREQAEESKRAANRQAGTH